MEKEVPELPQAYHCGSSAQAVHAPNAGASSTFANWGACELFALGPGKPQIKIIEIILSRSIFFKVTRVRRARKPGQRCMACARASHAQRTGPRWCVVSVRAACCSAVPRPLGLALLASSRNEARAVESHVGSNDRSLRTVLLSTIRSRNFMFQMCFACAFGCMRVVMRAHSSPMQHDKQLDRCKRMLCGMHACKS